MPTITFKTKNLKFQVREGIELVQVKIQNPDIPLKFGCKQGNCGICAIHVTSGGEHLTKMCPKEKATLKRKELESEYRLACQCALNGSIEIS